ncbi:hypothetical protein KKD80_03750 [Patescibacteria group bacterium]|nr:hypothetical protein [Patescibacteria group bacterium]
MARRRKKRRAVVERDLPTIQRKKREIARAILSAETQREEDRLVREWDILSADERRVMMAEEAQKARSAKPVEHTSI